MVPVFLAAAFLAGVGVPDPFRGVVNVLVPRSLESAPSPGAICEDVGDLLAISEGSSRDPASRVAPAQELLAPRFFPADSVSEATSDLDSEAASGTDSELRRGRLEDAGFRTASARDWRRSGEEALSHRITELGSFGQALAYHNWASRNTCQYAVAVFDAPSVPDGVGFRTRYRDGRTGEQVAFVQGNRRHIVLRFHGEPPADHREILALAESAEVRTGPAPDPL